MGSYAELQISHAELVSASLELHQIPKQVRDDLPVVEVFFPDASVAMAKELKSFC